DQRRRGRFPGRWRRVARRNPAAARPPATARKERLTPAARTGAAETRALKICNAASAASHHARPRSAARRRRAMKALIVTASLAMLSALASTAPLHSAGLPPVMTDIRWDILPPEGK